MLKPPELDRLSVVLVSTRNPLNIGAAARAMSNFGFPRLQVVSPYESAFREARSAVGAAAVLASAAQHDSVASAVAHCSLVVGTTAVRTRNLRHPLRRLEDGARLIRGRLRTSRVALLFGSEKFGLSNDDLSHCHWLLRIPTSEENISMNLGQAVAVCLYELIRDSKAPAAAGKTPLAAAAEIERITQMLAEALRESGFLDRRLVGDSAQRIRRLVRRLNLPRQDAVMWLGIFRQIVWSLRHPERQPPPGN
ncbi:MAG: TrmJ/YjtD family RNA methyltransferase [Acidobacteriota bacterium]|nr:TrmJ/YjtD family RNA methyltransferase [Acidobacteriota bacterium]